MTTVGKILVILITIFSLAFMFFAVMVFNTSTNWKEAVTKQKEQNSDLQKKLSVAKTETDAAVKLLDTAKKDHAAESKKLNDEIANLKATNEQAIKDITDARNKLETAQAERQSGWRRRRGSPDRNREDPCFVPRARGRGQ